MRALGWMLEAQAPSHLFTAMLSSHVRTSRFEWSYSSEETILRKKPY